MACTRFLLQGRQLYNKESCLSCMQQTYWSSSSSLPNIIKLYQTVWVLWLAQDFKFRGDEDSESCHSCTQHTYWSFSSFLPNINKIHYSKFAKDHFFDLRYFVHIITIYNQIATKGKSMFRPHKRVMKLLIWHVHFAQEAWEEAYPWKSFLWPFAFMYMCTGNKVLLVLSSNFDQI